MSAVRLNETTMRNTISLIKIIPLLVMWRNLNYFKNMCQLLIIVALEALAMFPLMMKNQTHVRRILFKKVVCLSY